MHTHVCRGILNISPLSSVCILCSTHISFWTESVSVWLFWYVITLKLHSSSNILPLTQPRVCLYACSVWCSSFLMGRPLSLEYRTDDCLSNWAQRSWTGSGVAQHKFCELPITLSAVETKFLLVPLKVETMNQWLDYTPYVGIPFIFH